MELEEGQQQVEDITPRSPEAIRRELRRRETVTGNTLAIDIIYAQRFILVDESYGEDFMKKISQYADAMLNDVRIGVVFYKAQIFTNSNVKRETSICVGNCPDREYVASFHAFSEDCLTESKLRIIEDDFLPSLITGANGEEVAKLTSTDIVTHHDTQLRKPVYK